MNYLVDYYGSSEDIPNSITSELNTYPGWSEYLNAYNTTGGNAKNYNLNLGFESSGQSYSEYKNSVNTAYEKGEISKSEYDEQISELENSATQSNATWTVKGLGSGGLYGLNKDDIDIVINGKTYDLKAWDKELDGNTNRELNTLATGDKYKFPSNKGDSDFGNWGGVNSNKQPGKLVVYKGNMYIYTHRGWQQVVDSDSKVSDCIDAYISSSIANNKNKK